MKSWLIARRQLQLNPMIPFALQWSMSKLEFFTVVYFVLPSNNPANNILKGTLITDRDNAKRTTLRFLHSRLFSTAGHSIPFKIGRNDVRFLEIDENLGMDILNFVSQHPPNWFSLSGSSFANRSKVWLMVEHRHWTWLEVEAQLIHDAHIKTLGCDMEMMRGLELQTVPEVTSKSFFHTHTHAGGGIEKQLSIQFCHWSKQHAPSP